MNILVCKSTSQTSIPVRKKKKKRKQKKILLNLVFPFLQLEDDGKLFYTLDDGHTRFTDLIQLVEFYQLNKGVLPCKLKHYCARIAL